MKRLIVASLAITLLSMNACDPKTAINSMISGGKDISSSATVMGQNAQVHGVKMAGHVVNAATLGEKDEDNLGQSVGVVLTSTYHVVHNDALTKYVSLVGLAVASTSPRPDIEYVFGILDSDEVNAFSGPNGYVFITRGTLQHMQDEAELAGVLGHEMSHVMLHHGLNQVKASEAGAAASEAVQGSPAAQWTAMADKGIDAITKTGYSQPQEYEADLSAVKIVSDAGYDPASYLHFLQRLADLQKSNTGAMSTHPGAASRVQKVTDQLKTLPKGGAILADRFKQNMKL